MIHLGKKFHKDATSDRTISDLGHKSPVNESFQSTHSKHGNFYLLLNYSYIGRGEINNKKAG